VAHDDQLALAVSGTFNWLCYFLAIKYLSPAVTVTLAQGICPLSMTAWKLWLREPVSRVTRRCQAVILAAAVAIWAHVLEHRISNAHYGRTAIAGAIFIAIVCSISISITATLRLSRTYAEAHVPASVVLSMRFPLLIGVCLLALPTQRHVRLDERVAAVAVVIGLICVTGGAYPLQRGVELAPALAVSTCLAISPIVVYLAAALTSAVGDDAAVFLPISVIVTVSLVSISYGGRQLTRTRPDSDPVPA
jgi:drug/metabolite transporter (DMT)-like permease